MGRYEHRLILLIVLLITACGPLPMPFRKDSQGTRNDLIFQQLPPVVAVNAVNGTSIPMAKLLAQAVAEELSRREVIAYTGDKGKSTHVLDGWVENAQDQFQKTAPSYILWALTKRDGELVSTFKYEFRASALDWDYGSPRIIREIGEGTAVQMAQLLVGSSDPAEQRVDQKTGVWVVPIVDAPGDGNFSLTRAMSYALGDTGIKITKTAEDAEFRLRAQVHVDSPISEKQQVKIDWILVDQQKQEIGRASQKNTVQAGTFDGRWGQTAVMIAGAAAGSIRDIVNRERNRRKNAGHEGLLRGIKPLDIDLNPTLPPPTLTPDLGAARSK